MQLSSLKYILNLAIIDSCVPPRALTDAARDPLPQVVRAVGSNLGKSIILPLTRSAPLESQAMVGKLIWDESRGFRPAIVH